MQLFDGDANSNLAMDEAEFLALLPTTGTVGSGLFYKEFDVDNVFFVNAA